MTRLESESTLDQGRLLFLGSLHQTLVYYQQHLVNDIQQELSPTAVG